jgi:hypothetical protein
MVKATTRLVVEWDPRMCLFLTGFMQVPAVGYREAGFEPAV